MKLAGAAASPLAAAGLALLLAPLIVGCSSPNRGRWAGTFDGTVTGTVEFGINARGTEMRGRMVGETSGGDPFRAELRGILRQDWIKADFEGVAGADGTLPVSFTGEMTGSLADGLGSGDWQATLRLVQQGMAGTWNVEQLPED